MLTGGEVFGETSAILVGGNGSNMITVAGTATGRTEEAIRLQGGSNVVTIADTGTVIGQTCGVHFGAGGTGANQVVNHGWLQGLERRSPNRARRNRHNQHRHHDRGGERH